MTALGKKLVKAAKEARAIVRGELPPSTYRVHVPAQIDVKAIRNKLKLSQAQFANKFGIAAGTLRDWEQHRKQPDGPARALLMVIDKEPEAVARALAGTA
jgi:putative transcriptional regulator